MFEKITPEAAGIPSEKIEEYIKTLEKRGAAMHSLLIMRNGKIVSENYWAPFDKDFCHRMYSQTKSFTAIGIGLLEEEGKLSLDTRLVDIFPEKIDREIPKYLSEQTVREMLTMTTSGNPLNWFTAGDPDRTHLYLATGSSERPAGTLWEYDSPGSQVLAAIVEKLSGMSLLDYLKSRLFDKMGTFKTATILKTPNGDSWGDSAMVCTARDIASFGQLCMNYGMWEGERLMNEDFLRTATSKVRDNTESSHYGVFRYGYGYQIWRTEQNGFAFVGMGDEITICLPDRGIILVTTADNQGDKNIVRSIIVNSFFDLVVNNAKDEPLPENPEAQKSLEDYSATLKLRTMVGTEDSSFREELSGRVYDCEKNPMGITEFSFVFSEDGKSGEFRYKNAQGDKVIPFGVNHNVFGKFPELGYSDEYGVTKTTNGFMYNDAASFAWLEEKKLILFVQIIDRYFGNMSAVFGFRGEDCAASFTKTAEFFLMEYEGRLLGHRRSEK